MITLCLVSGVSLVSRNKPLSCDDKSSDIPTPANKEISTQVDISHKRRRGREKRTTSKSASKVSLSNAVCSYMFMFCNYIGQSETLCVDLIPAVYKVKLSLFFPLWLTCQSIISSSYLYISFSVYIDSRKSVVL